MSILSGVRELEFKQFGDDRGHLVVVEGLKEVPFDIKRIFYIYGTKGNTVRGQHANRKTEFVLINVSGSCKVSVDDSKGNVVKYSLDKPHTGLYLPKMIWKNMYDFSSDSVLLVLCSEYYDSQEYIRDYDSYAQEMKNYK